MKEIKVVDARMGRGKSSAAIRYMNENKGIKKFIYITPFLSEVDRICSLCDFDQPDGENGTKLNEFKRHIASGHNIASTHALFGQIDNKALDLIKRNNYCLIVDESIDLVDVFDISAHDAKFLLDDLTREDEDGKLIWIDQSYNGMFNDYKRIANAGFLYHSGGKILSMVHPKIIKVFDEVYMMTYLFDGQYQKAYLDFFGLNYKVIGIERDEEGYCFSNYPDMPPPIDYSKLINIVQRPRMNDVGENRYAFSKGWFMRRGRDNEEIKILRRNLRNFFNQSNGTKDTRLWTCFKDHKDKLMDASKRYNNNFLQIGSRATNEFRDKTDVAYIANRFTDPNIKNFFSAKGIKIDEDLFALAEMLQWIWRSAIRDDKPINLYIPSKRMRKLLMDWMEDQYYIEYEESENMEVDENEELIIKTFDIAASPNKFEIIYK